MAIVGMTRRRRNKSLNLIDNENSRTLRFKKRKSTLMKKAAQLSTLCDVDVCVVCFGPDETVETWPENKIDVVELIKKFNGLSVKTREKEKQKYNLMEFLRDKKRKLDEKLKNKTVLEGQWRKIFEESMRNNVGSVFSSWDETLNSFSDEILLGLCSSLESKLHALREKIKLIKQKKNEKDVETHNKEDDDNAVNMLNQMVYQSNPSTVDLLEFNGDGSLYNKQAFSRSDFDQQAMNFSLLGVNNGNYYMGDDVINTDIVLDNGLLQESVYVNKGLRTQGSYCLAGESSSLSNYFCSGGSMNSQTLYEVLPMEMRPPLLFSDWSA